MNTLAADVKFHARQLMRNSHFAQLAVTTPTVFLLLRALAAAGTGKINDPTLWLDACTVGLWTTTVTAIGIIGYQRFQGTLEHLVVSPRPTGAVLGPLVLACTVLGLLGIPFTLLFVPLVGAELVITNGLATVVGFVLVLAACGSSGFVLAGFFVRTRFALIYEPILVTPIWLVSGVVIDTDKLPTVIQWVSYLNPLTSAVEVCHRGITGEGAVIVPAVISLTTSLIYVVVSGRLLRSAERKARIEGTLALS